MSQLENRRINDHARFNDDVWSFEHEMDATVPISERKIDWPSTCAIPYSNRHRNQDLNILKAWAYHSYISGQRTVSTIRRTLYLIRAAMLDLSEQHELPALQLADITVEMLTNLAMPTDPSRRRSLYLAFTNMATVAQEFGLDGAPTLLASDLRLAFQRFQRTRPVKERRRLPSPEEVRIMLQHAEEILLKDAPRLQAYLDASAKVKSRIPDDLGDFVTPLPNDSCIDSLMCAVQGAGILRLSFLIGARRQEMALLRHSCRTLKISREGKEIPCVVGRIGKIERSTRTRPSGIADRTLAILEETFRTHRMRHGIESLFFRGKRGATTQAINELLTKYQQLYGARLQGVSITPLVGRHVLIGEMKKLRDGNIASAKQAIHASESSNAHYGQDRLPERIPFSAVPSARRRKLGS
ncbi:hypothetical protein ACFSM5_21210 [Lacibacterium aquatile]|uniref:Integrase n=1 Tax=Lacibacterium aquatile TaxID=1168082 RepID=A0ABW5E1S5_9PROT